MKGWISWGNAAVAAIIFMATGIGFVVFGFQAMYSVDEIVNGDAYNYIIAANRGTGLIGVGISFLVIGSACFIISVLNWIFNKPESKEEEESQHLRERGGLKRFTDWINP